MTTAVTPEAAGAGPIAPHPGPAHPSSWVERYIARREAARRFLQERGTIPYLLNAEAVRAPNVWHISGWTGTFGDHDLIAIAEGMGMPSDG